MISQKASAPVRSEIRDDAPHLLVVDDDRRIRELLSRYLGDHGFRVTVAANAESALAKVSSLEFDLLIVDVMMPGRTGLDLTRELRDANEVPILMLTALSETSDRISGLEAGADDYLPKPFEPRELLLRISSILKRSAKPPAPVIDQVSFGPYQYFVAKRELRRDNQSVRLTDREQEILSAFAQKPGETVARHELLGADSTNGERKIDVQINRLRRKIEEDPTDPKWLQTVRGIGYRLCVD